MKYKLRFLISTLLTLFLFSCATEKGSQNTDLNNLKSEENVSNVEEIIVVCKTHFDIGYTHSVDELIPYYRTTMIDRALEIMERSKTLPPEQQFVWTAPAWVMSKVLEDWDGQTPARREKLESAFRSGRFVAHALPFTPQSDIMGPEEFARGIQYSSMVSQKYGLPLPRDAKVTDVPSHTNSLATGLAQSGVNFIHIGCNWPSGSVDYPGLFWWEGPDGSRVLTMYSSIYGTCTALWTKEWGGNTGEDHPGVIGTNFLPPKGWPHKVWLAILVTPDNSGPPKEDALKPLFDEVAEKMPGVKVRMGRMQDFADAIVSSGADLPVIKKEAPDTWIHGVMSDPGGMKIYRNLQPLFSAAEALNTQLQTWDVPVENAAHTINEASEKILLYGEHTWGLAPNVKEYGDDFYHQPADTYKALESSWEDKTDYIRNADALIRSQIESDLTALANSVEYDGSRIVVYNPLSWERSGYVNMPGDEDTYFFAADIPANGYKTFPLQVSGSSIKVQDDTDFIENEYYKIAFDPGRGVISSFIEKQSGKEWVSSDTSQGFGQYMNERFTFEQTLDYTVKYQNDRSLGSFGLDEDKAWPHPGMHKPGMVSARISPYRSASPANGSLNISGDALVQTAVLALPGDSGKHLPAIELHVRLESGMPYVDIECVIKDKKKDNWPQADWLCLPFNINNPTFNVGRGLGSMNPATDIMKGSNRHLYSTGSGVTITDSDGSGVAMCPLDHPLISLDQPGCWKYSDDFVPEKPILYLNLFNNMWNTNFRYWYSGRWSSRIRVWTFNTKTGGNAEFVTASLEARLPLMTASAHGKGGVLPKEQNGITCSRKGVIISAYSQNANKSEGTLLRVWEQSGISGELAITFPSEMKIRMAQPVNLRGEDLGESLSVKNGKLRFDLGKYAPASFILKL
ncbi:hypothetical protein ACFL6P_08675 [Candidatus Latescibacterota bacterium]